MTSGTARAARASPTPTTTTADSAGSSACGSPRRARRHEAPRVNDGQAERGERAREAEAEGDDQEHPERHLVLRDGGQQHYERRRAGDQAGRGAHAEEAAVGECAWSCS